MTSQALAHRIKVLGLYREIARRIQLLPPLEYEVEEAKLEMRNEFRECMKHDISDEATAQALVEADNALGYLRTITPRYVTRKGKKPYSDLVIEPVNLKPEFNTKDNSKKEPELESHYYFVSRDD